MNQSRSFRWTKSHAGQTLDGRLKLVPRWRMPRSWRTGVHPGEQSVLSEHTGSDTSLLANCRVALSMMPSWPIDASGCTQNAATNSKRRRIRGSSRTLIPWNMCFENYLVSGSGLIIWFLSIHFFMSYLQCHFHFFVSVFYCLQLPGCLKFSIKRARTTLCYQCWFSFKFG